MSSSARGFGPVLRNRNFLLIWLAQVFSQIAQNGSNLVQIVLIETLTRSSGQIAVMVLAFTLPGALLSILAGVIVDRVSNRLILVASNALRVVLTLGYLFAYHALSDWAALTVIYVVTFAVSAIGQFFAPAESATIPALVERESLISANALFNLTMTVSQLIGLIVLFPLVLKAGNNFGPTRGIDVAFALVAIMYLVAAVLVMFLPKDDRPYHPARVATPGQTVRDMREGWRFVRHNVSIYIPILHLTMVSMLVMVLVTIGPGFASRVLGLPPEDAIYIFTPAGAGMLLNTYLIGRVGHGLNRDRLSIVGEIGMSASLAGLAAVGWVSESAHVAQLFEGLNYMPFVMGLALVLGISVALIAIPAQTSLQDRSPSELRGRVFALLYTMTSLIVILPLIFLGALADRIGIPSVSALVALCGLGVAAFCVVRGRAIAKTHPSESPS